MKPLDSQDVWRRFRVGDRSTLELVYREHVGAIEQVGRRGFVSGSTGARILGLQSRADLADFVQEVFSKAFSRAAREAFDGLRDYGAYLTAIARNALIDRLRRAGREIPLSPQALESLTAAADEVDAVGPLWHDDPGAPDRETVATVERYLATLPAELRAVFHQRYELGEFQVTAASNLGITRQSLRTLEHKLRRGLERALARAGLDRTAGTRSPAPRAASAAMGPVTPDHSET